MTEKTHNLLPIIIISSFDTPKMKKKINLLHTYTLILII